MGHIGTLVGELLSVDKIAVIDIDGKRLEASNRFNLKGRPNARVIISEVPEEDGKPMLMAVTSGPALNVPSSGGS